MKIKPALGLLLMLGVAAAQDRLSEPLRKAIIEEEANQDLDKAIQAYNDILAQYDEQYRTAATALFHLADCYRKQGKKDQAIAAYQRLVRDFADQTQLADASRRHLTTTFGLRLDQDATAVAEARRQTEVKQAQAETYRKLIEEEMTLVQNQLQAVEKRVEIGVVSPTGPEITALRKELIELRLRLEQARAGEFPAPKSKR